MFFINLNYITNFNPIFLKKLNKFNYFYKNKIFCKNFFLFLFLLKYINKNKNFKNITIFIKPFKKNFNTILRAPYRYKLSRHQIGFFRYYINLKIIFKLNIIFFKNYHNLNFFLSKFINLFKFIESNFIYNNKIKLFFKFKIKNNFNLINFNN